MNIDSISKLIVAVAAAGALFMSIYNATQINSVHVSINSRVDQLLLERGRSSKAEGVTQERARQDAADSLDNK